MNKNIYMEKTMDLGLLELSFFSIVTYKLLGREGMIKIYNFCIFNDY